MTLKNFLSINALFFLPFGVAMVLVPSLLFPLFGINLNTDGELMARVFGSALLSIGLMCYLVRSASLNSKGLRAILLGNLLFHSIDTISTLLASIHQVMNALGWMFFGLHLIMAIGFLYYLWIKK